MPAETGARGDRDLSSDPGRISVDLTTGHQETESGGSEDGQKGKELQSGDGLPSERGIRAGRDLSSKG